MLQAEVDTWLTLRHNVIDNLSVREGIFTNIYMYIIFLLFTNSFDGYRYVQFIRRPLDYTWTAPSNSSRDCSTPGVAYIFSSTDTFSLYHNSSVVSQLIHTHIYIHIYIYIKTSIIMSNHLEDNFCWVGFSIWFWLKLVNWFQILIYYSYHIKYFQYNFVTE